MSRSKDDAEKPQPAADGVPAPDTPIQITSRPQLGICECGSASFSLVSEMNSEEVPGIRVSRMYECTVCGTYRLEK